MLWHHEWMKWNCSKKAAAFILVTKMGWMKGLCRGSLVLDRFVQECYSLNKKTYHHNHRNDHDMMKKMIGSGALSCFWCFKYRFCMWRWRRRRDTLLVWARHAVPAADDVMSLPCNFCTHERFISVAIMITF